MKFVELTYKDYPVIITDKDINVLSIKLHMTETEVINNIKNFMETGTDEQVENALFFDEYFQRYHLELDELKDKDFNPFRYGRTK